MKVLTTKSVGKYRPLRIYKNKNNRKKYVRRLGKKLYIKTKGRMTNSNVVKVVVNNHIARHATTKTPSSKKKSAFTQKLDKSHTPIPNSPYHQAPPVVVVPQNASTVNDKDNKHSGEIARLRRHVIELETKHKEITPTIGTEPVGVPEEKNDEETEEEQAIESQRKPDERAEAKPLIPSKVVQLTSPRKALAKTTLSRALTTPPVTTRSLRRQTISPARAPAPAPAPAPRRTSVANFNKEQLRFLLNHLYVPNTPDLQQQHSLSLVKEHAIEHNKELAWYRSYYYNDIGGKGDDDDNNDDGMTTSQIAEFLDIKTHHIVPVIAKDQMDLLLPFVNSSTKQFYFVINSDPISKSGTHWRAGGIDINDGSCFFMTH